VVLHDDDVEHDPLRHRGVVGTRAATTAEARMLGDPRGAPVLTMTRTAWDESGRAVEYGSHLYRASRYSFEPTLSS
jgi:DNA-binding GntR family transcriptional regulator